MENNFEEIFRIINRHRFLYYYPDNDEKEKFLEHADMNRNYSFSIKESSSKGISNKGHLVLTHVSKKIYISILLNKGKSTSVDYSLKISSPKPIDLSFWELYKRISQRTSLRSRKQFENLERIFIFSEKLNEEIFRILWSDVSARNHILFLLKNSFKSNTRSDFLLKDAINFVLKIAESRDSKFLLESEETFSDSEDIIVKLREDMIINYDVNDEKLLKDLNKNMYINSKTIYANPSKTEKISVYLADKNELEEVFGVDIIYVNHIQNNIVMVQYKMLEKNGERWVFRDNNKQLEEEIARMDKINNILNTNYTEASYRINPTPFFLRFIKRNPIKNKVISFIITLEHYKLLINSEKTLGERGGRRIDFEDMNNHYIGKNELIGMIRSGYVGTYSVNTKELLEIIKLIAGGDNKNDIVIAFKEKLNH